MASSNVRAFNRQIERWAKQKVPETARRIVFKVRTQAVRGVVLLSPVKTGRFRGNWQASGGEPITEDRERFDKSGRIAIAEGVSRAATRDIPMDVPWFLANPLPYAERLEDGYSSQAPAGMVGVTLDSIAAQFGR